MEGSTTKKNWIFIDKEIKCIKTPTYGCPYTAVVDFRNVNGQMHLEGMLAVDSLTFEDWMELEAEILRRGFKEYTFMRFKNGVPRLVTRKIK